MDDARDAYAELLAARDTTTQAVQKLSGYVRYDSLPGYTLIYERAVPDIPAWRFPGKPLAESELRGPLTFLSVPLRGDDMWMGNLDVAFDLPAGASGTVYRDPATGFAWVVRPVRTPSGREAAASAIYSELGLPAAGVRYSIVDGKSVLATEWAYGNVLDSATLASNGAVVDGFAADVLLGNRRAADPNSYVIPSDGIGSAVRTDMQRVLDLEDGFDIELGDWTDYAVERLTPDAMVDSAEVLSRISDDRLRELITTHVPGPDGVRLADTVVERRKEIMLRAMRTARENNIKLPDSIRAFIGNDASMPSVWPVAQRSGGAITTNEIEDLLRTVRDRDSVFRSVVNEMSENERKRARMAERYSELQGATGG